MPTTLFRLLCMIRGLYKLKTMLALVLLRRSFLHSDNPPVLLQKTLQMLAGQACQILSHR